MSEIVTVAYPRSASRLLPLFKRRSEELVVAEGGFRRLDAPELRPEVAPSVAYVNGC